MNLSGFFCLQICWYFNQHQNLNSITFPFLLSLLVREDVIQKTGLVMLGVRDRKNIIKSNTFHLSSGSKAVLFIFKNHYMDSLKTIDLYMWQFRRGGFIPIKIQMQFLVFNYKMEFYNLILSNTTMFWMIFLSNSTLILIKIIFIMSVCFNKIHFNNYYIFIHISHNFSSVFCFALNYSHAHQLNCQLVKVSRQKGIYKLIFRKTVSINLKNKLCLSM